MIYTAEDLAYYTSFAIMISIGFAVGIFMAFESGLTLVQRIKRIALGTIVSALSYPLGGPFLAVPMYSALHAMRQSGQIGFSLSYWRLATIIVSFIALFYIILGLGIWLGRNILRKID